MERPIFKPLGTPVEELDTPALVVDLAVLGQNIETMHSFFRDREAKLRPHVASHRSPAIAHMQLAAGGTVGGVSVTTVGQAEVFCENGISDVLVANVVVTPAKIARLCALARRAGVTVAVDSAENVGSLSERARADGVSLDVVVDVDTRADRHGVEPGQPAVDLADAVSRAEGLSFAGLMSYDGPILADDGEHPAAESRRRIGQFIDTRAMVEKAGMDVRVVSVGGTYNYEIAGTTDGVTEVAAGSYALMDKRYGRHSGAFKPAARVMGTVTSVPEPGFTLSDAGAKAIGADGGLPAIDNIPGATVRSLSAEHGEIVLEQSRGAPVDLGDKVWFTPWDIGTCANLHDYISAVRDGRLEAVWSVAARGRYR